MKYDDVDDLVYGVVRMVTIPCAWYYHFKCHSMRKKGGMNYSLFIKNFSSHGWARCLVISRLDHIVLYVSAFFFSLFFSLFFF